MSGRRSSCFVCGFLDARFQKNRQTLGYERKLHTIPMHLNETEFSILNDALGGANLSIIWERDLSDENR